VCSLVALKGKVWDLFLFFLKFNSAYGKAHWYEHLRNADILCAVAYLATDQPTEMTQDRTLLPWKCLAHSFYSTNEDTEIQTGVFWRRRAVHGSQTAAQLALLVPGDSVALQWHSCSLKVIKLPSSLLAGVCCWHWSRHWARSFSLI
jgi:hypothetical protein